MAARFARRQKVEVGGKFLTAGGKPFFLRGVTYGPFAPQPDGSEYKTPAVVDRDFARMAAGGFNTVRTYTVPPTWLLDIAYSYGLRVFIGVPWEQHVTFLDTKAQRRSIVKRVEQAVAACSASSGGARLRRRQRDPGSDGSLVRPRPHRAVRALPLRRGEERGSERPRHLRQLSRPPSTSISPFSTS